MPHTLTRSSTASDICYFYDMRPDLTLKDLSGMTGRSVVFLKGILMGVA